MLADTLNFTRAAQQLFITQSTLSHQIIQLEQELATPLFNRSGRSVHLTPAGQLFKNHAKLILRQAESAKTAVDELGSLKRGQLNIGTVHSFNHYVLLPVVSDFMQKYPAVRVTIEETSTARIEAGLIDGTFDFGATVAPVQSSELEMEALLNEDYVVVARKRHKLAKKTRVRFSDLANVPLAMVTTTFATRRLVDLHFEVSKLVPNIQFESNSIEVILDQVNRSDLISILPLSAIATRKGFVSIGFSGSGPKRTSGLCWLRNGHRPAAALVLAGMIQESLASQNSLPQVFKNIRS